MVNIRDVAQEAGVSVSTVSKVVNKTGSISESTRKRVLKITERLDYHPNAFARGLVTHKVENIAFMWDRSSESPFSNPRSEERRVGKECRSRWSPYHQKKKHKNKKKKNTNQLY